MNKIATPAEKTVINLKVDRNIKEQAKAISKEIGLPLSTLMNTYLRQFVRTKEVYLSLSPTPNLETAKQLRQATKDIKAGKNITSPFKTKKEVFNWLDS